MMQLFRPLLPLLAGVLATSAAAADPAPAYLSFGGGYVQIDNDRAAKGGQGYFLGAGLTFGPFWGVELGGFSHGFDAARDGGAHWREYGAQLDGLFFYSRAPAFSPYFVLGGGVLDAEERSSGQRSRDPFGSVGLGFFKHADFGGTRLGLRADLRYRWTELRDFDRPAMLEEPVMRLGLVLPLGAGRKPVLPAAALADDDGDGVGDGRDLCPGTPVGAGVDRHGCPLDADGDAVPDGLDRCPGTRLGQAVDATGCPRRG